MYMEVRLKIKFAQIKLLLNEPPFPFIEHCAQAQVFINWMQKCSFTTLKIGFACCAQMLAEFIPCAYVENPPGI